MEKGRVWVGCPLGATGMWTKEGWSREALGPGPVQLPGSVRSCLQNKLHQTHPTPPQKNIIPFSSSISVTTNETLLASPSLLLFLSSFPVYAHKSARHAGTCTPAQPRCACARAHTHWSGPITASLEQEPMRARLTHRTSEPHPHTERRPRRNQNPAKHPHFSVP